MRDLPKDPALPHSNQVRAFASVVCSITAESFGTIAQVKCIKCDGRNTVFFTASGAAREQSMALYFVCANPQCSHMWRDVEAGKQ